MASGAYKIRARTASVAIAMVAAAASLALASSPAGAAASAETAGKRTVVKVMETRYGPIVVSGGGRALYLFTKDKRGPSQCYDECATAWPPYIATGKVVAGKGAEDKKLGTVQRTDGSRQVTYAGKPLYFYIHDTRPGQVTCHDVFEFGGTWLAVQANGRPVK